MLPVLLFLLFVFDLLLDEVSRGCACHCSDYTVTHLMTAESAYRTTC